VDPVSLAIEVKRGALRLREVPAALQGAVYAILSNMTDAQAGLIAERREGKRRWLGRSHSQFRHATS